MTHWNSSDTSQRHVSNWIHNTSTTIQGAVSVWFTRARTRGKGFPCVPIKRLNIPRFLQDFKEKCATSCPAFRNENDVRNIAISLENHTDSLEKGGSRCGGRLPGGGKSVQSLWITEPPARTHLQQPVLARSHRLQYHHGDETQALLRPARPIAAFRTAGLAISHLFQQRRLPETQPLHPTFTPFSKATWTLMAR